MPKRSNPFKSYSGRRTKRGAPYRSSKYETKRRATQSKSMVVYDPVKSISENYVRMKLHYTYPVQTSNVSAAAGALRFQVRWMQPQSTATYATNNVTIGYDSSSTQWNELRRAWQQMAITGVSIKWIPTQLRGSEEGAALSSVSYIGMAQVPGPGALATFNTTNLETLRQASSFTTADYTQPFTKYIPLAALCKSQNVPWRRTASEYVPNSVDQKYPLGLTAFIIPY